MSFNLRVRTHLNYYEPEEPGFDEYLYCERCADYVYDYCAIHGPLLVVPDNEIYDSNNKRSHVLDAVDCDRSNWMRYVNCSRHWKEQNLLAYQYRGQLYYRTVKIIPRYTELMVFYGSEFANALHINLSRYNSAKHYKEIISTPTNTVQENKDDGTQVEYLTADQFHFIDENLDKDHNNKSPNRISISLSTNNDQDQEIARSDNETKEDFMGNSRKRYECETCQKTFASTRNLKEHVLTHLNIWKFNCEYCLFKSNKNYNFKRHVGKHTNTFKFSCETCSFKTNYGRTFKRHCFRHESSGRVLENINPRDKVHFPTVKICDICDFKTNSRKGFSTHMSKHKGIMYKCDKCPYSNHSKYNLSRHITRLRH